jgi:hypothetical protein
VQRRNVSLRELVLSLDTASSTSVIRLARAMRRNVTLCAWHVRDARARVDSSADARRALTVIDAALARNAAIAAAIDSGELRRQLIAGTGECGSCAATRMLKRDARQRVHSLVVGD